MNQLIHFIKSLFLKQNIQDGCISVGDTTDNFTFGSVNNLQDILKNSNIQDQSITQWNQNKNRWSTMFCTCVAPICAIASIFNRELTDKEMYSFFLYAKKEYGYKAGVGNNMSNGIDAARNYWNSTLAKDGQQVVSFLTQLGTKDSEDCLDKGYGLCFCYSGNSAYNLDKKDRLLNGTNFGNREYGHCTQLYKIDGKYWVFDSNKGDFDDRYKVYDGNYSQLIQYNWHKEAYVFLPINTIVAKPKTKLQIYLEKVRLLRIKGQL